MYAQSRRETSQYSEGGKWYTYMHTSRCIRPVYIIHRTKVAPSSQNNIASGDLMKHKLLLAHGRWVSPTSIGTEAQPASEALITETRLNCSR